MKKKNKRIVLFGGVLTLLASVLSSCLLLKMTSNTINGFKIEIDDE